jgi:hypothetical protein
MTFGYKRPNVRIKAKTGRDIRRGEDGPKLIEHDHQSDFRHYHARRERDLTLGIANQEREQKDAATINAHDSTRNLSTARSIP